MRSLRPVPRHKFLVPKDAGDQRNPALINGYLNARDYDPHVVVFQPVTEDCRIILRPL